MLARVFPDYARLAWWGLASPRLEETEELVVHQAVVRSDEGVLLTVRSQLRGWELPGGGAKPGESSEAAAIREVLEETGFEVAIEHCVGRYVRTGFRPHVALVYRARVIGGSLRTSRETPRVAWFPTDALPGTLFPWFRTPLEDELGAVENVERHEYQGIAAVVSGLTIDLRMRWSEDAAQ